MTDQGKAGDLPLRTFSPVAPAATTNWRTLLRSLAVLFKLRIVSLLLLAAVGGAFLAAGGWPGGWNLALLLVTGAMAASGASALNQYLERKTDGTMGRTRLRPLASGAIVHPEWVLALGIGMILLPSLAVLPSRPALAFFLLLGAFVYVGIYTVWLKPRSLLNIVIGGAAGSAAVMSGGAAAGGWEDPAVITLALLVFLWTPSHFWTLAILYRQEYGQAEIPMLPVMTSPRQAAFWILLHTAATALAALILGVTPALGAIYLIPVALATIEWFRRNFQLIQRPTAANARSLFMASNLYLFIVLVTICLDTTLTGGR